MGLKIRKVKFLNDNQFGNLELDFINSQIGLPYSNIIFVGDNGVGKTNLLRSLEEIVGSPIRSYIYKYVEYELSGRVVDLNDYLMMVYIIKDFRYMMLKRILFL